MSSSDETSAVIENHKDKNDKKSLRKQKRAHHRLLRDMNIKCSDRPTQHLMICNGGLVTGIKRETLQCVLDALISKYVLIMPTGKSYCFITCNSKEDAICVYNYVHGRIKLPGQNGLLYVCYTETVPSIDNVTSNFTFPPGLTLIENFVTKEQEETLLRTLNWENECESISSQLKHRQVKHFGYEFEYGTNMVNPENPIAPIPQDYKFLQTLFDKHNHKYTYDQLTINKYLPGQGIPSHIDTHSVFEDTILSLSLSSGCIINFKKEDQNINVFLPSRSLLIMTGEARYAWTHGICPRHNDVIETENGPTTQERGIRVSFTFRKVRRGDCCCNFKKFCDTRLDTSTFVDAKTASGLEDSHVHKVYEEISSHFSETRHKQWPNVTKFLKNLEEGTLLLDVGCGNGKYLYGDRNIYKMGCDRSSGLTDICHKRGFEVLQCDCLYLPYRDNSVDAAISIAVIHHLSTPERRRRAISEMIRVLRPTGKCLIYVWAKEQRKDSTDSCYLKYGKKNKDETEKLNQSEINREKISEYCLTLPVHENRMNFAHSDMLVPWKKKGGERFLRYYHVFQENELAKLCMEISAVTIKEVYYDQDAGCIIISSPVEVTSGLWKCMRAASVAIEAQSIRFPS